MVEADAAMTAREAGLVGCPECGRVRPAALSRCPRCGARAAPPSRASLHVVWALLLTGVVAYIPANVQPMLITRSFGMVSESTIVGGAIELAREGAYFVAAVVLLASVAIPIAKFIAIAYLAFSIGRRSPRRLNEKRRLHEIIELIGRWSMIDVFVVAVLAALVQLGFIASISPGPAAAAFALSVVATMLSAQWLDRRLIWTAS